MTDLLDGDPHWREKAREALTRGGHHPGIPLAGMLNPFHYDQLIGFNDHLVNAVAAALRSAYEDGEGEGKRLVLEAVGALLSEHGCDCDCCCAAGEHDDDCDPCLGCRIDAVLTRLRRGEKR